MNSSVDKTFVIQLKLLEGFLLMENITDVDMDKRMTIADWLNHCLGNMELNASIREAAGKNDAIHLDADGIIYILDLTFLARNLAKLYSFYEKAISAYNRLTQGETLTEDDKIDLDQFAVIRDLALLMPIFKKFSEKNLLNDDSKKIYKKIEKCNDIVDEVEKRIQKASAENRELLGSLRDTPVHYFANLLLFFVKRPDPEKLLVNSIKPTL